MGWGSTGFVVCIGEAGCCVITAGERLAGVWETYEGILIIIVPGWCVLLGWTPGGRTTAICWIFCLRLSVALEFCVEFRIAFCRGTTTATKQM